MLEIFKNSKIFPYFLYGISTSIKLISSLVIIKIISSELSTAQFGIIGQFMSFMLFINIVAGGGLSQAIIKYGSEIQDTELKYNFISQIMGIILILNTLIFSLLIIFSSDLSTYVFQSNKYQYTFIILAFLTLFIGISNYIITILNTNQATIEYTKTVIYSSILTIAVAFMVKAYEINITISAIIIIFSYACPSFLLYIKLNFLESIRNLKILVPTKNTLVKVFPYTIMLIATITLSPGVQIYLRDQYASQFNWDSVGYWQAIIKLSDAYLQFFLIVLANFLLPKLSQNPLDKEHIKKELFSTLKILIPLLLLSLIIIKSIDTWLIIILFDEQYKPAIKLINYQLVGDFFKVCSFSIAYILVAQARTLLYIAGETIQCFIMVVSFKIVILTNQNITLGHAITYFLYLIICLLILKVYLKRE